MTVGELCDLFPDAAMVEVFSFERGETIYKEYSDEIPDEICESEVSSIDPIYKGYEHLTLNIE